MSLVSNVFSNGIGGQVSFLLGINNNLPKLMTNRIYCISASNTGECPSGIEARGCGPQEVFRGCADIAIA